MATKSRGILESIRVLFSSVADIAIETAEAGSTTAKALNELASAGLVMSQANREIVEIRTSGKKAIMLRELAELYDEPEVSAKKK